LDVSRCRLSGGPHAGRFLGGLVSSPKISSQRFYEFSLFRCVPWPCGSNVALKRGGLDGNGAGGGAGYRVTPSEDIGAYLRKASLERLGRTMSKADVDKAIAAIQGVERTQGPQAPNIGVMAEQQVVKLNPNEDKAVRFRRAIDVAMNLLGG